jgi:hypothetical protein
MKAGELAESQKGCWRKIAISLVNRLGAILLILRIETFESYDQEWEVSDWHGASVLPQAPHLRPLLPAQDGAQHDTLQEM